MPQPGNGPPVETCVIFSARPNSSTASAVSPPPTTVTAFDAASLGDRPRALAVRLVLELAHRAVPDHRPALAISPVQARSSSGRCPRRSSRRGCRPRRPGRWRRRGPRRPGDRPAGRSCPCPARGSPGPSAELVGLLLAFVSRTSRRCPALGLHEQVRHRPADQHLVDPAQQALDEADLVRHLGPAEDAEHRPRRVGQQRSRISSSLATSLPTTRGLPFIAAGTATIEASLRWQVPKASLT